MVYIGLIPIIVSKLFNLVSISSSFMLALRLSSRASMRSILSLRMIRSYELTSGRSAFNLGELCLICKFMGGVRLELWLNTVKLSFLSIRLRQGS